MERDPFMYGLMETEDLMMTAQLMAMPLLNTPSLLELWELMALPVPLMRSALLKWSLHTSQTTMESLLW